MEFGLATVSLRGLLSGKWTEVKDPRIGREAFGITNNPYQPLVNCEPYVSNRVGPGNLK